MRGPDAMQEGLFTVAKLDDFVPADHPLRSIRVLVNNALVAMNSRFNQIYSNSGRDSIAPEKLIRALLLQVFYSIRSERQLCEQLRYNLLFRWFVGLALDDPVWDHSTFSKNRDRLLEHKVVESFFAEVLRLADGRGLLSKEHFSVDGTLIQAWASQKSFGRRTAPTISARVAVDAMRRPIGRGDHAAMTRMRVPPIRTPATIARAITRHRFCVTKATRSWRTATAWWSVPSFPMPMVSANAAQRWPCLTRCRRGPRRSVGADKAYDTTDFVAACRERNVTPHVAATTLGAGAARSTVARPAIRATASARSSANGSRNPSAGEDHRPDSPNRFSRIEARRPAVQAHHDCQQSDAHGPNTDGGALAAAR